MPKKAQWPPRVTRHASGQARVKVNGQDVYLGVHGSKEAAERYAALVRAGPPKDGAPPARRTALTVAEAVERYDDHARLHYRHPDGRETSEMGYVRAAGSVLLAVCPSMKAEDFRGRALKDVRAAMVAKGWARSNTNHHVNVVKRIWKWLAGEELVTAEAYGSVRAVEALKAGRTEAPESPKVRPAPLADVLAALPYLSPHLEAAARLQLYTACRPGEALALDTSEIDRAGAVWLWAPARHKTAHHGKARVVLVGPKAQAVLEPLIASHRGGTLFQPRLSEALRRREVRDGSPTRRRTGLAGRYDLADRYDGTAYAKAMARACAWAEVPRFAPNQIRHLAATLLAAEYGPLVAQTVLGHAHLRTSEIYCERDLTAAVAAIAKAG